MIDFSPMREEEKQAILDNADNFASNLWSTVDKDGRLHL